MKYGKAFIGLVAIVTDTYDSVTPGTRVEIKGLTPNVGIFNVKVLDGPLAGENRLIHSTRLKETGETVEAKTEPKEDKEVKPAKTLQLLKVSELPYAARVVVIERNRKVNLKVEAFTDILNRFVEKVKAETIFSPNSEGVLAQLPGIGLGLIKDKINVNYEKLRAAASVIAFGNEHQLRVARIEASPVRDNEAVGYFFIPAADINDMDRWAQSGPDNFELTIMPIDLDDPANETYGKHIVTAWEKEFAKMTRLCKEYYREIQDRFEELTSDRKVEEALKPLWYLETGDVVPASLLEQFGVK